MGNICVALVLLLAWSDPLAALSGELPESLTKIFQYDQRQALDIQIAHIDNRDHCKVYDLTYVSPRGGRVPAYLIVPDGKGPFGAIVFGHWGNGNRTEFLPEAELYAR